MPRNRTTVPLTERGGTVVAQSGGTVAGTTVPLGISLKGYIPRGGTVKVSPRRPAPAQSTGSVT